MKISFNQEQIDLARAIDVPFDICGDLSSEEICSLTDFVADHLTLECLDVNYVPNAEGVICEDILEILGNL